MRCIARITFQYHEFKPPRERVNPERRQAVLHLYRVIGNSPSVAASLCRQGVDERGLQPSVAITIEDLKTLGRAQIVVCKVAKQTCEALERNFQLCGVTAENRKLLADAGLLDGIGRQNIHGSVAALVSRLCNNPGPRRPLRQPFAFLQTIGNGQGILGLQHRRAVLR